MQHQTSSRPTLPGSDCLMVTFVKNCQSRAVSSENERPIRKLFHAGSRILGGKTKEIGRPQPKEGRSCPALLRIMSAGCCPVNLQVVAPWLYKVRSSKGLDLLTVGK